jgi:hypothetical protein
MLVLIRTKALRYVAFLAIAAWGCLELTSSVARAEGYTKSDNLLHPTGGGVDRKVRTKGGYYCARALATIDFSVPTTKGANKWNDNASFYLGGSQNGVEVDAGISWDANNRTDLDGTVVRPGYSTNISVSNPSVSNNYVSPLYWDSLSTPNVWRIWRNRTSTVFTLEYRVHTDTGSAELVVAPSTGRAVDYFYSTHSRDAFSLDPFTNSTGAFWPDLSQATSVYSVNAADLSSITVKRTAAMNRMPGVHAEYVYDDGSYMYVNFSEFEVIPIGSAAYVDCSPADIDQTKTGFDSPPNGQKGAKDKLDKYINPTPSYAPGGGSKYRVNFPYLASPCNITDARTNSTTSINATSGTTGVSRYTNEYVEIWLRHGTNKTLNAVMYPKKK